MSVQIEDLLDSLRTHGTIDSTGEFSVDVQRAHSIVPAYQTSDPHLFLVALVSAGLSAGAEAVDISVRRLKSRVSIIFSDTTFSLTELEVCFNNSKSTSDECLLDALLGLRAAFRVGVSKVEFLSSGEALTVTPKSASLKRAKLNHGKKETQVILHYPLFKSILRTGDSKERTSLRHLRAMTRLSRRPLSVNGESIASDYDLELEESYYIKIGALDESRFPIPARSSSTKFRWSGALGLRKGKLQFVVNGVTRGTLEHPYFHGVIYHPEFRLDVSREQIVQNEAVREIEVDLISLFRTQLEEILCHLDLSAKAVPWYFYSLWSACVVGDLGTDGQARLSSWFTHELAARGLQESTAPTPRGLATWERSEPQTPENSPSLGRKLIWQGFALDRATDSNFELNYPALLKICQQLLEKDLLENAQLLETILEVLAVLRPKQTLLRAYLLLGLGANYQKSGNMTRAEKAWEKAVKTVASRRHRTEEQLIRAHLDFGLEHILGETQKLLEIQIQALEQGQWI